MLAWRERWRTAYINKQTAAHYYFKWNKILKHNNNNNNNNNSIIVDWRDEATAKWPTKEKEQTQITKGNREATYETK